jgi:hypothetical protein
MKVLVFPALLAVAIVASPPKPFTAKSVAHRPVAQVPKTASQPVKTPSVSTVEQSFTARR